MTHLPFFSSSLLLLSTIAALSLALSCGDSSSNPNGQSGAGGAEGGGAAGADTGGNSLAGAGKGGGGGGNGGGGAAQAGDNSGGVPEGGDGAGGAPAGGPIKAVMGQVCPLDTSVGVVQLSGFPEPYVQATLYDRVNPWVGDAELSTATCAYHHYTAGGCPTCEAGETCSVNGSCVPERRTVKDAKLLLSVAGEQREYAADAEFGNIYATVDLGSAASSYAMTLTWGETQVVLEPMAVATGKLMDLLIDIEGDSQQPGALNATWTPSTEGAFVRTTIPINHHAGGPTFTECGAPDSAGSFHAEADMVNPLSVVTGLEFQGVEHVFVAAADTPEGCVEFRFGVQVFAFPE